MVSVIVPIYKVEKFLHDCIDSILNQTYKNLEIILVDDGSPDNCGNIADEYSATDSRIKVIHKINGGLSDARNAGINIAKGEYITFVDSDDFLLPEMIANLVNIAEREQADMVVCQRIRCTESDNIMTVQYENVCSNEVIYIGEDKMYNFLVGKKIGVTAWAKLYKSNLFSEVRYPYGKYHEDVFTTYKLVHTSKKIVCTDFIGYVYRINSNSIMQESFSVKSLDVIEGKLIEAEFIETYYPKLKTYAYAEVIYACNKCLMKMAKAKYSDESIDNMLTSLYRKYTNNYLAQNVSIKGKIFAIVARFNLLFAKIIISLC